MVARSLSLIALVILAATPSAAQTGRGPSKAFAAADADGDGRVTRAEFVAHRTAQFDKMDRDGDGVVASDDFARIAKRRPEARARIERMIAGADGDGDGRLTRAELAAAPVRVFDRADTNRAEIAALASGSGE